MQNQTCGNCRFYEDHDVNESGEHGIGPCHRHPPTVYDPQAGIHFHTWTESVGWCGEWDAIKPQDGREYVLDDPRYLLIFKSSQGPRERRAIAQSGATTLRELIAVPDCYFLSMRMVGEATVRSLREELGAIKWDTK